jgi:hypothetical protein
MHPNAWIILLRPGNTIIRERKILGMVIYIRPQGRNREFSNSSLSSSIQYVLSSGEHHGANDIEYRMCLKAEHRKHIVW